MLRLKYSYVYIPYLGLRKDHERAMQHLQKEKENIEKKLQLTKELLDTQVKKLKQQVMICMFYMQISFVNPFSL